MALVPCKVNGPINGTPYPLGLLAAGQDMTALDRVMTEIIGVPWKSVYTLEAAQIKNYGQWDLKKNRMRGRA